jgi:hypothetical protein
VRSSSLSVIAALVAAAAAVTGMHAAFPPVSSTRGRERGNYRTTGVHRVTSNSEAGRRMISSARDPSRYKQASEIYEWNHKVDEANAAKKAENAALWRGVASQSN